MFALAVSFSAVALGADGAITKTLKYGMKDVQVKYLQQTLNETGVSLWLQPVVLVQQVLKLHSSETLLKAAVKATKPQWVS